ncbi:MAG: prolipoprotein diacylglyceryl transferase [Alistipes sp.]|nr:prolipoprotein diacylglyceryl transferase [Alistipes sp.]
MCSRIGLLLIFFVISRARRFDGENTCFYFLWYGIGRFFIEGLRTDSLYLFDWQIMGQPIRVSQALSLVMIVVSLVLLFVNGNKKERKPLFVDVVAAAELAAAEAAAAEVEEVSAEDVVAEEETVKEEVSE